LELAEALRTVLEKNGVRTHGICHAPPRVGDVKRNYSDTSKARHRLGWDARVGLEDGLDRTVKWFLQRA
jgi:UDP-glucose 4-epimerase